MKKLVAMILVASLCITFLAPLTLAQTTAYQRGYEDGKRAANRDIKIAGNLIEALWGFLLGPIPVAYTFLSESKVSDQKLRTINNRSQNYRDGYKTGYTETVEQSTLLSRIGGWAGWIAVWAVAFSSGG